MLPLVLAVFYLGTSGAFLLEESIPAEQLDQFLSQVLEEAQVGLSGYTKLDDVNIDIDDVYYTIPFKFAMVAYNTTLIGPTDFSFSEVTGQQELSRSASIQAKVELGELRVSYSNLRINLYGLEYSGPAEISLFSPQVTFSAHIYRNVLSSCQASVSISRPEGMIYVSLGGHDSLLRLLMYAAENLLSWIILPQWLVEWSFFPDVSVHLEEVISNAVQKIACK